MVRTFLKAQKGCGRLLKPKVANPVNSGRRPLAECLIDVQVKGSVENNLSSKIDVSYDLDKCYKVSSLND